MLRLLWSSSVLTVFLAFLFISGVNYALNGQTVLPDTVNISSGEELGIDPIQPISLSASELSLGQSKRRVFIVGDVHGTITSLKQLLASVSFDEKKDKLIHVGDLVAKSGVQASLETLSYMAAQNVTGVVGNHDIKVLQWRRWLNGIMNTDDYDITLRRLEEMSKKQLKKYLKEHLQGSPWGLPSNIAFPSEHYWIARNLTDSQFKYLSSLPPILHLPPLHSYIVHAGLLPLDPSRPLFSQVQPLSHPPRLTSTSPAVTGEQTGSESMRLAQEIAILRLIPQNSNLEVVTTMRSLNPDGSFTSKAGDRLPWSEIWNAVMTRCSGFNTIPTPPNHSGVHSIADTLNLKSNLPCKPSTVIYGHAAGRGLDIKRWSLGLDSGCVYGRQLSMLVLASDSDLEALDDSPLLHAVRKVNFGDSGWARIVSIRCPAP